MLNMENLNKTEKWANEAKFWHVGEIIAVIAKISYDLSYPRWPRNFNTVIEEFRKKFCSAIGNQSRVCKTVNELTNDIYSVLMSIDEFRKWNLTNLEYANGVNPDDDGRNIWWEYSDKQFIDLEAFKQNIYCCLRSILIENYFFHGDPMV